MIKSKTLSNTQHLITQEARKVASAVARRRRDARAPTTLGSYERDGSTKKKEKKEKCNSLKAITS
jgi:hypothetical protein